MTQQPEALRLADRLDQYATGDAHQQDSERAAAELRRLHEVTESLWQVAHHRNDRITTLEAALRQALEALEVCEQSNYGRNWVWPDTAHPTAMANVKEAITALRKALAEQPAQQEPVAWRDHVEQRLLTWRQSFVNKSGDQLALDDFMDKRSLDDLIDFVCDEYTRPQAREPLTNEQIRKLVNATIEGVTVSDAVSFRAVARAIEAAHGIKGDA